MILLDLNLGEVSGLDYLAQLKRLWPAAKIILLTILDGAGLRETARAAGADGFVSKLQMNLQLKPVIQKLLEPEASK